MTLLALLTVFDVLDVLAVLNVLAVLSVFAVFSVFSVCAVISVLVVSDVLSVLTQSFDLLPIPRAWQDQPELPHLKLLPQTTTDYYYIQTIMDRVLLARPHVEASL